MEGSYPSCFCIRLGVIDLDSDVTALYIEVLEGQADAVVWRGAEGHGAFHAVVRVISAGGLERIHVIIKVEWFPKTLTVTVLVEIDFFKEVETKVEFFYE